MAHGYLGDGFGSHGEIDPDRDDRDWRERGWRDEGRDWRNRRMMFGGPDRDEWRGGRGSSFEETRTTGSERRFSQHPEDHYRNWRDRHMSELDRDYADYCREREQQFQRDFDDWRRQKYGNPQPLQPGMTQSGISHDPSGATQALEDESGVTPVGSDPAATATLGTNSQSGGRGRR